MNKSKDILDLIDELRAMAQTGLNYARDPFDLQRYHRIMELACRTYGVYSGLPTIEIQQRFSKELGYITPKIGVQCALFNETGEILLEKRADDSLWGLPGGWVDVSEGPEETVRRELKEETNLLVGDLKVIGFYTRLPGEFHQPHTSVHILYYCGQWDGVLTKSFESLAMEFRDAGEIEAWHKDHRRQVDDAIIYRKRAIGEILPQKI